MESLLSMINSTKNVPMNPHHDRESRTGTERFFRHRNIQIQTLELTVSWYRIIDTSRNQNLPFPLRTSRAITGGIKRRLKRIFCSTMCPSLVKHGIWKTAETSYAFLNISFEGCIERWGMVIDSCGHFADVENCTCNLRSYLDPTLERAETWS